MTRKDQLYTVREALKDKAGWKELIYHPVDAPPVLYILHNSNYAFDLLMWVDAFNEQSLKYPDLVKLLASKMADEQMEFIEAVDAYCECAEKQDRHQCNAAWLHVMDEAADALNTAVAYYLADEPQPVLDMPEAIILDALEEEVDSIAELVSHIQPEQLESMTRAVLTMSAAKLRITELRPHAQPKS